ncbi:hypothetical protein N0V82_005933 [Gnomoniopsis sp. IMI 355080]|nr:hypothetical protein N0V82_005933 [Gnomoniopsis sp. IMI 355080]
MCMVENYPDPSSIQAPFFANKSCDPFTSPNDPCRYGNYVRYTVNVSTPDDVAATVAFAKEYNIRFVIRNTGHDYLGRSTGAGAISVWTHHLKDIAFLDWDDANYTGKAVKVGAGVQGFEVLEVAKDQGLVVLTGECPSVGIAGGYTQGGGHSALATSFGLSADNTLQFEVITADGQFVTASPSENPDLYWALSGGGGGNFAVVYSMTVKAHPEAYVGGVNIDISTAGISNDTFDEGIRAFSTELAALVDAGSMVIAIITPTSFQIGPVTAYNKTAAEVEAAWNPFLTTLSDLNITYTVNYTESPTYYDHFVSFFGPLPTGTFAEVGIAQYGGRLVPRSTFEGNTTAWVQTIRSILDLGSVNVTFVAVDVSGFADYERNAVVPAWRMDSGPVIHTLLSTPWSFDPEEWGQMLAYQKLMTDTVMPALEAVTPGSGAYMNEGDFLQPNFQQAFFGSKYERLLKIKKKYDPDSLFYATKGVGSEAWTVAQDGHMCRTGVGRKSEL